MGKSGKWAQLCTWMEGHESSPMNHHSTARLPQISMIYPQQERPAMRGGQMHQVFSRVLLSCTCVDDYHTLTQVEPCLPKNIYTQRNDRYTKRILFSRSLAVVIPLFAWNQENLKTAKKKKKNLISNVIHLYGRLAGWFKWVQNSCRGQSAGEVVLSWGRQGWVEGEVIMWFHRNSYLQKK